MRITLIVLRCADVERARRFYAALGLRVRRERHGDGPVHYSATVGGVVLELYPRGSRASTAGLRLGVSLSGVEAAARRAVRAGGTLVSSGGGVVTLDDPDGHRVVVEEARGAEGARPMVPAGARATLARALRGRSLVTLRRAGVSGWDRGWVVSLGRGLVALAVVSDGILLDGYRVLRIGDVATVEVDEGGTSFAARALALRGVKPPAWPRGLVLSSFAALLRAASEKRGLVTVHQELDDPDVCWIGRVASVGRGVVRLHEITPDATWTDELDERDLTRVTRVDFGGSYETALAAVAAAASSRRRTAT